MIDVPALVRRNEELRADNISLNLEMARLTRSLSIIDRDYDDTKRYLERATRLCSEHSDESNRWHHIANRMHDIVEKPHMFEAWKRASRYLRGEMRIPWIDGPVPPTALEHIGPVIITARNDASARRGWFVVDYEAFVVVYCDYTAVEVPINTVRRYFLV